MVLSVAAYKNVLIRRKILSRLFSMEKIVVNDPSIFNTELESAVNKASASKRPLFLYFTGAKTSGLSWCPDCTRAEPVIDEVFGSLDCVFLEFNVIRENYRSEEYPYRTDQRIQLKCVPTLILWKNNGVIARLNDSQCQNKEIVKDILDLI